MEKSLKIAVFYNLLASGAKRNLFETVKALSQRGHTLDVYTLSCADQDYCDVRPWVAHNHVFPFKQLPLARRPFGRINQLIYWTDLQRLRKVERQMAQQINTQGYDVAFVSRCFIGWSAILEYLKIPSVYYCQAAFRKKYEQPIERPYTHKGWRERLDQLDPLPGFYIDALDRESRRTYHAATIPLAVSEYVREGLIKAYGGNPFVFYQGVDLEAFTPASPAQPRSFEIVSVGQVSPHKGFDLIIKGLACLPADKRPGLTIIGLSGDGLEREYLQSLAAQGGVKVNFRQGISQQELVQAYRSALVAAFTPHLEPFGLVPLEAMACGTPVIGVREAGVRETIRHGETGYLVARDAQDFARAVLHFVEDPALSGKMGSAGREDVETRWNWRTAVDQFETYLQRAIELHAHADEVKPCQN